MSHPTFMDIQFISTKRSLPESTDQSSSILSKLNNNNNKEPKKTKLDLPGSTNTSDSGSDENCVFCVLTSSQSLQNLSIFYPSIPWFHMNLTYFLFCILLIVLFNQYFSFAKPCIFEKSSQTIEIMFHVFLASRLLSEFFQVPEPITKTTVQIAPTLPIARYIEYNGKGPTATSLLGHLDVVSLGSPNPRLVSPQNEVPQM